MAFAPIQDVVGGLNIPVEQPHSFIVDRKLGNVLRLTGGYAYSVGGSPAHLKESNGFSVSVWAKPESSGCIVGRLDGSGDYRWFLSVSTTSVSVTFKVSGTVITMAADVELALDEWSHLTITIRKAATDTYTGEVYVDGKFADSFGSTSITTASMDTTGNITLGGVAAEITERFPPVSIGSYGGDWINENSDPIIDSEESVDDDPTAYTDSTYWRYVYNAVDDWLTPQFVSGHDGSGSLPHGLRFRTTAEINNHGCAECTLTVLHSISVNFHNGESSQMLAEYFPGNDPDDGIAIPADNEPHFIEVDLTMLPVIGYDDNWAVNVVFSSQGSGSHTVTLYDFDLVETVSSYRGCLKDLRLYNRPLEAGEAEQIAFFGEQLYEMPNVFTGLGYDPSIPIFGSGGVVVGGTSIVDVLVGGTAGLEVGGTALTSASTTPAVSGGVVLGGSAQLRMDWHVVPTGGVRLSRYPHPYKRTITVPAGTVTESYERFYLGVIVDLNPEHVVDANFVFTDQAMKRIPFEVREYDADSGRLTAYVRTPVSPSTDTILYIFYGAA